MLNEEIYRFEDQELNYPGTSNVEFAKFLLKHISIIVPAVTYKLQTTHDEKILTKQGTAKALAFLKTFETDKATDAVAEALEVEPPMQHETMESLIDERTSIQMEKHGQRMINQALYQSQIQKNLQGGRNTRRTLNKTYFHRSQTQKVNEHQVPPPTQITDEVEEYPPSPTTTKGTIEFQKKVMRKKSKEQQTRLEKLEHFKNQTKK